MITSEYLTSTPLRQAMSSVWYPGFIPNVPDLLVFRLPNEIRRNEAGRPLNNAYKIIFVETPGDRRVVEESLDTPLTLRGNVVDFRVTIDRPNARRSSFPAQRDTRVLLYVPPEEGWPHFVLTMLARNTPGEGMARDRYGWDAFSTEGGAQDHMTWMVGQIKRDHSGKLDIRIVTPDITKFS